ncbi:MAG: hypothetical protein QXF26_05850 [Candidatus Bathyarchaeia archaeon]
MGSKCEKGKDRRCGAKIGAELPIILRQVCLIFLISAVILISTLAPIPDAAAPETPSFVIKQDGTPITDISVTVCSTIELYFCTTVPDPGQDKGMVGFAAMITWDTGQVILDKYEKLIVYPSGWTVDVYDYGVSEGELIIAGDGPPWTGDVAWLRLFFHCHGPGQSTIVAKSTPAPGFSIWIGDGQTTPEEYEPDDYVVTVNQYSAPPPRVSHPVGGEVYPVNKLAALAPYLSLVGLASLAAVAVKRRRR